MEDVDDYGRPSSDLEVSAPDGMGYVPMMVQWGIGLIMLGIPYFVWVLTNRIYELAKIDR